MKIRIFLVFIIILFSSHAFTANIRVIDFQKIIDDNVNVSLLYDQINKDQTTHKEKFVIEELDLKNELKKIEKLNLILDPVELEKEIQIYNEKLNDFNYKIEKFNLHYEKQINFLKNSIVDIVLQILKKYSEENNIDLILDSSSYILSSNSINITNIIKDKVNKKKIEINFEKF